MKLYIFDSVNDKYRIPFSLFVINQNIKVARITSLLIVIACVILKLSNLFIDYSFIAAQKQYRIGFSTLLITSAIYYIAIGLSKKLSLSKGIFLKKLLSSSYPLVIIFSMMWLSFVSGRSPANNMTIFMFGLLFVGVIWLYSIKTLIATTTVTYVGIIIGLFYFVHTKEILATNLIAGIMLMAGFYFISRMLYSYHANYFIQLKQIERNNREITKMAQLKTEMLGIVAHDLRSPINSVAALVELSCNVETTPEEQQQYNSMILSACDEANNIIKDLILIVKGESAQQLQLKESNINIFLSEIQQNWTRQIKDDKKVLLTLPENIITANIDEDKMLRVLDNLVSNAIKFTDSGATIRFTLSQQDENTVQIVVSDNGIGIPDEMQPIIFERFTKAGRLGLKGEKSHGLGLNICKQIVERHGGKITLKSKVGEGTSFYISLPAKPSLIEIPEIVNK